MKNYHVNTHPDYVTISELAHWGENHSDLWVQQLAKIVSDVNSEFSLKDGVRAALSDNEETIRDLEDSVRYAKEYQQEAQEERDEAVRERDALRFDLDKNEQHHTITALKARIYELSVELTEAKNRYITYNELYSDLKDAHDALIQKHK